MPTSYSYTINTICAYLNCKHAKCMLHLNFLLFSFVCLFVCFVGEVSEGIIGRAGQSGSEEPAADRELRCRQSAGAHFSWELGRGGITATRGLLIAPRQYVCGRDTPVPPPTPAPARPQPILLLLPGKGTGVPAAGSASPHLGCPPPPPSSSRPLPPPPCALPHPAPTGGSGADPAVFARPPLPARRGPPPSLQIPFYPLPKSPGLLLWLALLRAVDLFLRKVAFISRQGRLNGLNGAELTHH